MYVDEEDMIKLFEKLFKLCNEHKTISEVYSVSAIKSGKSADIELARKYVALHQDRSDMYPNILDLIRVYWPKAKKDSVLDI